VVVGAHTGDEGLVMRGALLLLAAAWLVLLLLAAVWPLLLLALLLGVGLVVVVAFVVGVLMSVVFVPVLVLLLLPHRFPLCCSFAWGMRERACRAEKEERKAKLPSASGWMALRAVREERWGQLADSTEAVSGVTSRAGTPKPAMLKGPKGTTKGTCWGQRDQQREHVGNIDNKGNDKGKMLGTKGRRNNKGKMLDTKGTTKGT